MVCCLGGGPAVGSQVVARGKAQFVDVAVIRATSRVATDLQIVQVVWVGDVLQCCQLLNAVFVDHVPTANSGLTHCRKVCPSVNNSSAVPNSI